MTKKNALFLLPLSLLLLSGCGQTGNAETSAAGSAETAQAAETSAAPETVSPETAQAEVAAAVERFNRAMVSADRAELEAIAAPELSYGHSSGKVQDKAAFVEDVAAGPFDFLTAEVSGQTISLAGETALVRHVWSARATNAGKPTDIRIGNLLVFQRQQGQWKLLARQAFKL